tara:strand:- start:721 stop:1044 length:324 start_codon:yes stop_codon:yes gene_type:complete
LALEVLLEVRTMKVVREVIQFSEQLLLMVVVVEHIKAAAATASVVDLVEGRVMAITTTPILVARELMVRDPMAAINPSVVLPQGLAAVALELLLATPRIATSLQLAV